MTNSTPDLSIHDWSALDSQYQYATVLLGNGVSIGIDGRFRYDHLVNAAPLAPAVSMLFSDLETTNFEEVLRVTWEGRRLVSAILNLLNDPRYQDLPGEVDNIHDLVRSALWSAVHAVHPEWTQVDPRLEDFCQALGAYDNIFTLCYDMLPYWAIMKDQDRFGDYFWSSSSVFNSYDVKIRDNRSAVHFLHGALHLWQDQRSYTEGKWTNSARPILAELETNFLHYPDRQPLFVSEGLSKEKMRSIRQSEYLSFALGQLRQNDADTVIFGTLLGRWDDHITDALGVGKRRNFAVSVWTATGVADEATESQMFRLYQKLGDHSVKFFDSRTHPLGML